VPANFYAFLRIKVKLKGLWFWSVKEVKTKVKRAIMDKSTVLSNSFPHCRSDIIQMRYGVK
jgi:hypothetical protein